MRVYVEEVHLAVFAYLPSLPVENIAGIVDVSVFAQLGNRPAYDIHSVLACYR
jgi:hypothetical protein